MFVCINYSCGTETLTQAPFIHFDARQRKQPQNNPRKHQKKWPKSASFWISGNVVNFSFKPLI